MRPRTTRSVVFVSSVLNSPTCTSPLLQEAVHEKRRKHFLECLAGARPRPQHLSVMWHRMRTRP